MSQSMYFEIRNLDFLISQILDFSISRFLYHLIVRDKSNWRELIIPNSIVDNLVHTSMYLETLIRVST